jgi:hypothetical protein
MYNFTLKTYEYDMKLYKREKKYQKKLIKLKEERVTELIKLFGGKYKKADGVKKPIPKEEEKKTETFLEKAKGVLTTAAKSVTSGAKKAAETVSTAARNVTSVVKKTAPVAVGAAAAGVAILGTKNVISKVLEVGPGYNVVQRPDGSTEKQTGARNWRNNNPGNIEYKPGGFAEKHGAIGSDGRFAIFPTYETGRKAKEALIFEGNTYKNLDLKSAISKYAPPNENNTGAYQAKVLSAVGGENKVMSSYTKAEREAIMTAMEQQEGFKQGKVATLSKGTKSPALATSEPTAVPATPTAKNERTSEEIKPNATKKNNSVEVSTNTKTIPEKITPPKMSSDSNSVAVLNNTTNVIHGGITYGASEENHDRPVFIEKQYNYS